MEINNLYAINLLKFHTTKFFDMRCSKEIRVEHPELDSCLTKFLWFITSKQVENLYEVLSPNLKKLVLMEEHKEKFQEVFIFHRKILGFFIHKLEETHLGHFDAIVLISLVRADFEEDKSKSNKDNREDSEENIRFKIYRFKFIRIDGHWYVDDVYLNNDYKIEKHKSKKA